MCFSLKYHCTCSVAVLYTIETWHKGIPVVCLQKSMWVVRISVIKFQKEKKIVDFELLGDFDCVIQLRILYFYFLLKERDCMHFNHTIPFDLQKLSYLTQSMFKKIKKKNLNPTYGKRPLFMCVCLCVYTHTYICEPPLDAGCFLESQ